MFEDPTSVPSVPQKESLPPPAAEETVAAPPQPSPPVAPATSEAEPPPASVSAPVRTAGDVGRVPADMVGRTIVMPENFYVPPKRPTVGSRVVVIVSIALLVAGVMWGAGFFISQNVDVPLPFLFPKRKKPPVSVVSPVESTAPVEGPQGPSEVPPQPLPPVPPAEVPQEVPLVIPEVAGPIPETAPIPEVPTLPEVPSQETIPPETPLGLPTVTKVASGADADADGLTDEEEKLYLTDPTVRDSDNDGFPDGAELVKLYAPNLGEGKRLEEAGITQVYTNPVHRYRVFAPASWVVKATDNTAQEVIFTSSFGTGEFVSILFQENSGKLPIRQWYERQNQAAGSSGVSEVTTPQGISGLESADGLTTYLAVGPSVFVVSYNIGIRTDANFLSTAAMMRNSFTLSTP